MIKGSVLNHDHEKYFQAKSAKEKYQTYLSSALNFMSLSLSNLREIINNEDFTNDDEMIIH